MRHMHMDAIQRIFFRLLRSGTFGDVDQIEPLSAWKWRRIYQLSLMHGVAALVGDGIEAHSGDFFMQLPRDLAATWRKTTSDIEADNTNLNLQTSELLGIMGKEQLRPILLKGQGLASLYANPLHRTGGDIDIFFPYAAQARKADEWASANGDGVGRTDEGLLRYTWNGAVVEHHGVAQKLSNPLLNRRLQSIINSEVRCCDSAYVMVNGSRVETVPPTLNLLLIMIRIAHYVISEGVCLKQIVDLGVFLRTIGDKVDYVKLQGWLKKLGMEQMAQLEGALLVQLFNFDEDEMQFVEHRRNENLSRVKDDIFSLAGNHSADWYFTQGKNIFVHNTNSGAMLWHIRHSARYFKYYPKETVTNFISSFINSMSHIEE